MRILLSGGIKTQNIISGIDKKFQASGDDFLVVEYIDDIMDVFSRGDYFDKAVITEQSITKEYTITDDNEIRRRINKFALNMASKPKKYSYVFLAQTEEMAERIHEEILPILNESAVVLKEPPYAVTFFVSIIVTDVKQLPADIVFTPELDIPDEIVEEYDENEMFGDMDESSQFNMKEAASDFDRELFGGLDTVGIGEKVTEEVDIDTGADSLQIPDEFKGDDYESFIPAFEAEFEPDSIEVPDENTEESTFNEEMYKPVDGIRVGIDKPIDNNQPIEFDNINPIKQSEQLPNFVTEAPITEQVTPDIGFIPGFDNEEYDSANADISSGYTELDNSGFSEEIYSPNVGDPMYDTSNPGNINYDDTGSNQFNGGFGADDYVTGDDTGFATDDYSDNSGYSGFDNTDYVNDNAEQDYQQNMDNSMYNQGPDGFRADDYSDTQSQLDNAAMLAAGALAGANMLAEQSMAQVPAQNQKRRGLLGKIKNSTQNTVMQAVNGNRQNGLVVNTSGKLNVDQIKNALKPFAARGNSIVVTGCGGCGTSTIAYNLANIVTQLGYTALLVDMDTEGRTQSYISKDNYESMEPDGANLMSAVNSSNGIGTHISVVKQGFHLLTMGLGTDTAPVHELLHKEKLSRFTNLTKTSHNFIIYDIPFKDATGFLSDIIYMADNLVLVTDASNWGITKTMLSVCNIASDDMQDTVFSRAQLVFNKYRNLYRVLGRKVKTCVDITKVMDQKVLELVGDDPGFHFEDLHIAGIINDDPDFENGWFEEVQYSDTKKGQEIFLELIEHIVLKK